MGSVEKEVFKTLAYSDYFNYPLTFTQMWQYLISDKIIEKKDIIDTLKKSKVIGKKNIYFFLKGKIAIVDKRIEREKISLKKLLLAKHFAKILSLVPTVIFVGISGSLAMKNAAENDDIDFFIISSPGTIWITRIICVLILFLFGVKRKRIGENHRNKICLNMYLDGSQMALPLKDHNLYTAHEVVQVMPVVNKNNIHELFLKENAWVLKYMPNSIHPKV